MRYAPVPYTAVDALLILEGLVSAHAKKLTAALHIIGIPAVTLDAILSIAKDADGRIGIAGADLITAFHEAIERIEEARLAIARTWLEERGCGDINGKIRQRIAGYGVHPEIAAMFAIAMDQQVNLQAIYGGITIRTGYVTGRVTKATYEIEMGIARGILWKVDSNGSEQITIDRSFPRHIELALPGRPLDAVFKHPLSAGQPPIIKAVRNTPFQTVLDLEKA